jgi:hypothetical protein
MRKFEVKQINGHIWLLNDNDEATGYVVAGEKMAMVIDTMFGFVNVKEEISDVTIMLEQIKYLLHISETDINHIIEQKLNRQLERIEKNE